MLHAVMCLLIMNGNGEHDGGEKKGARNVVGGLFVQA